MRKVAKEKWRDGRRGKKMEGWKEREKKCEEEGERGCRKRTRKWKKIL